MRAAVIGGGVFGCTVAVDLARAGVRVDLYEARGDILEGATARCQGRLHSGYHYPRSDATAAAARDAAPQFAARYPEAIRRAQHHYVIDDEGKTSPADYLAFCDRLGLPYEVVDHPLVHRGMTVRVPEALVDPKVLRRLLRRDLFQNSVRLHPNGWVEPEKLDHDLIVVATYGRPWSRPLRYEIVETAMVELGVQYAEQSFVILDGPFASLDPIRPAPGARHMLYDVVNSVHAVHEGSAPIVRDGHDYADLLKAAGVRHTPLTHFSRMVETAGRNLRGISECGQGICIYAGSWFAVRAVLSEVDGTDERPTLVERDGNVISILSGKICTAVTTARQVTGMAMVPA